MKIDDNIDAREFHKLLSIWKQIYKWKTTSFIAIKTSAEPKLLIGRIIFDSVKSHESQPFRFESTHIIAGSEITKTSSEDVDLCIANAIDGDMVSSERTLSLFRTTGEALGTYFSPIYHPSVTLGPRMPSLIIRGSSKHGLLSAHSSISLDMLNWDLKGADMPFDSLDELLTHLGFQVSHQTGDSTILEIVGLSPAYIADDSKISASNALIKCKLAEAAEIKEIKFGYKIFQGNLVERGSIKGDAFLWITDNSLMIGAATIPTSNAPVMQGFLSYGGISLHQWWIDDPLKRLNSRHAIHEIFDKEFSFIKKVLFTVEGRQNRAFEHGMALLLSTLGFSVTHYGKLSYMEDGPDIIAITQNGNVGVIECTTGLLDAKGKLSKLVQRTTLIREHLTKTGHAHLLVQPAIVTALHRKEIEADLDRAGENGIAVLCKENIEDLLKRVTLPTNSEALFQEAKQLIPRITLTPSFRDGTG